MPITVTVAVPAGNMSAGEWIVNGYMLTGTETSYVIKVDADSSPVQASGSSGTVSVTCSATEMKRLNLLAGQNAEVTVSVAGTGGFDVSSVTSLQFVPTFNAYDFAKAWSVDSLRGITTFAWVATDGSLQVSSNSQLSAP